MKRRSSSAPKFTRQFGIRHDPSILVFIPRVPDWTIRSATEQDIEQVLFLWNAAGGPPTVTDTREGLRCLLAADQDALLIAQADELVVGSLIAAWDGWRGSFYRLAVHPDRRRQAIATALLQEGERRLRARGAVRLTESSPRMTPLRWPSGRLWDTSISLSRRDSYGTSRSERLEAGSS
jgi:GNAT superfamily N-acetyltransferase